MAGVELGTVAQLQAFIDVTQEVTLMDEPVESAACDRLLTDPQMNERTSSKLPFATAADPRLPVLRLCHSNWKFASLHPGWI